MRVTRIEIENFRSIRYLVVDLGETTVFVGPNNAGKTAILDALRTDPSPCEPGSSARTMPPLASSALRIAPYAPLGSAGQYDIHLADDAADPKTSSGVVSCRGDSSLRDLPVPRRANPASGPPRSRRTSETSYNWTRFPDADPSPCEPGAHEPRHADLELLLRDLRDRCTLPIHLRCEPGAHRSQDTGMAPSSRAGNSSTPSANRWPASGRRSGDAARRRRTWSRVA